MLQCYNKVEKKKDITNIHLLFKREIIFLEVKLSCDPLISVWKKEEKDYYAHLNN